MKFKLCWNQWLVGFMLDYGHIIHTRWLVILVGPLTISIPCGRVDKRPWWAVG